MGEEVILKKEIFYFSNYLSRYYKFCFEYERTKLQLLKLNYDYVEAILNDEVESLTQKRNWTKKSSVKVLNSVKSVRTYS